MARIQISQEEICRLISSHLSATGRLKTITPQGKGFVVELAVNEFLPPIKLVVEFVAFKQGIIHLRLQMQAILKMAAKWFSRDLIPGVIFEPPDIFVKINELLLQKTPLSLKIQNVEQQSNGDFLVDLQLF